MLTDEQLDTILCSLTMTCHTGFNSDPVPTRDNQIPIRFDMAEMVDFVGYVRRLRKLERACKRLFWRTEHGERYMPAQSLHGTNEREAIATIGRLLEGA